MIAGCLAMLLCSTQAFALQVNVLVIHGRWHDTHERYGHFRTGFPLKNPTRKIDRIAK